MVKQIKWTDRKFEFNLPAGVFPALIERLLGTPPRIEEMTKGISDDVLSKRHNGAWSVKEHIGHLTDLEALHEKRLGEILEGKTELSAADMSNKKTNDADHNSKKTEELLVGFGIVRKAFVNRLASLDDVQILRSGIHPRLKIPMRIIDIAYFTSEHDDHHLAIMRRLLSNNN